MRETVDSSRNPPPPESMKAEGKADIAENKMYDHVAPRRRIEIL